MNTRRRTIMLFACRALIVLAVLTHRVWTEAAEPNDDAATMLARIAFGSCCKQGQPQPIWDALVGSRPDVFIFLGDCIHGDTTDVGVLRAKWAQLGAEPGYRALKGATRIMATWDDHDYGLVAGGAENKAKAESQQLFLDFFDVPASSPRRQQAGVYNARVFGPAGRRTQIILLDTRYFRSPLKTSGADNFGHYVADDDPAKTILGAAQWKWLEEQLAVPAELRVIGSSVQVLPHEHHSEKWGNFPRERRRLLDLIRTARASAVVLVSGDRHWAEISRWNVDGGYPLYEITSSSLNQPSAPHQEPNALRVCGPYIGTNFGLIDVDWNAPDPLLRLQIRSVTGELAHETPVRLGELKSN